MAVKPVEIAQLPQTIKKLASTKDIAKMKLGKAKFVPGEKKVVPVQKAKVKAKAKSFKKSFKKKY